MSYKITYVGHRDIYGSYIHKSEWCIVDYTNENIVHSENIQEYFSSEYDDYYIENLQEDEELIEYISKKYGCGVYNK